MHGYYVQIMYALCIDYACSIPYIAYEQYIMHNLCIVYTYFFYMGILTKLVILERKNSDLGVFLGEKRRIDKWARNRARFVFNKFRSTF